VCISLAWRYASWRLESLVVVETSRRLLGTNQQACSWNFPLICLKTPVTLGWRSHGDLDRHQIAVQNSSIAVGAPRTPKNGVCVLLQLQTLWDHRLLKNAVGTPCNRHDNAVQSPNTSWQRSESVVMSPWERQGGRQRLHRVHAAFMAIPKRLHYDPTEFSWRLLLPPFK
jgi:hypothetical protein